jgi:hypothetical protein
MKQIINRKLYDTERAEQIARYAPNADTSDFHHIIETLYKNADGEYFLHGQGGAQTEYAERIDGGRKGGEELTLLGDEEALDWCEKRGVDVDIVIDEFDGLVEQ